MVGGGKKLDDSATAKTADGSREDEVSPEKPASYTIKQVSEKSSLPPHVLRYYENEGLLPGVARSRSGIRRYSESDLEWLALVCCLKNTGMSIKQIKNFVELSVKGEETLKERCELLREHKRHVEAQIAEMRKHLEKVTWKIEHFTNQYERYAGTR
ncbi:MAG: MerR family transcriptional regulator [Treponema sp.]|jgi:DNA-binding transcriptional MerR regulator|nr:MerR family transcriptional regulator [Treponema sp.]